ncbi:MAG TPA: arsenate reductase ArsC [Anaerolineales bacterium]|nr:arsenate reductase ArsC [Anaerolineales bacterium]
MLAKPGVHARILVLCTGNSCRSQMAEGWFRHLGGEAVEVDSAGSRPAGYVHPLAVRVMAEASVDISGQRSRPISDFLGQAFDYVITLCDEAAEACPVFPGRAARLHWGFEDPADAEGDEAQRLEVYRRVRDGLRTRVESFLKEISS